MGTTLSEWLKEQQRQALGPVNKWYCSQHFGYEVTDSEVLLAYYIKHGGALQFRQDYEAVARRFESLTPTN